VPAGTEINARTGQMYEEGWETEYVSGCCPRAGTRGAYEQRRGVARFRIDDQSVDAVGS
jgi:hypothetical protein